MKRIAFVVPDGTTWSLPLYELALMTARQTWSMGADWLKLVFVTPESRPLAIFGGAASDSRRGAARVRGDRVRRIGVHDRRAAGT